MLKGFLGFKMVCLSLALLLTDARAQENPCLHEICGLGLEVRLNEHKEGLSSEEFSELISSKLSEMVSPSNQSIRVKVSKLKTEGDCELIKVENSENQIEPLEDFYLKLGSACEVCQVRIMEFYYPSLTADINKDGVVDDADLLAVLMNLGSECDKKCCEGDVNSDGVVDDADLLEVLMNLGSQNQDQLLAKSPEGCEVEVALICNYPAITPSPTPDPTVSPTPTLVISPTPSPTRCTREDDSCGSCSSNDPECKHCTNLNLSQNKADLINFFNSSAKFLKALKKDIKRRKKSNKKFSKKAFTQLAKRLDSAERDVRSVISHLQSGFPEIIKICFKQVSCSQRNYEPLFVFLAQNLQKTISTLTYFDREAQNFLTRKQKKTGAKLRKNAKLLKDRISALPAISYYCS